MIPVPAAVVKNIRNVAGTSNKSYNKVKAGVMSSPFMQQKVCLFQEYKECTEKVWNALQADDLEACANLLQKRQETITALEHIDAQLAKLSPPPAISDELAELITETGRLEERIFLAMNTRREVMAGEMNTLRTNTRAIKSYLK